MNAFSPSKLVRLSPKILFRRAWMKYVVQASKLHFADDHARHDLAYTVEDPWSLSSDLERHRFDRTADAISRRIGTVETALEIGSAEGFHTQRLLEQCRFVDCIECMHGRSVVRRALPPRPLLSSILSRSPARPAAPLRFGHCRGEPLLHCRRSGGDRFNERIGAFLPRDVSRGSQRPAQGSL